MRFPSTQTIVGLILCAVVFCPVSGLAWEGESLSGIVQANNAFAVDLYRQLKSKEGNLFISPYSISSALAMTYAGARGKTKQEMAKVLYFSPNIESVAKGFSQLDKNLDAINKRGMLKITTANSLWIQEGYALLDSFLDITKRYFKAGVNLVNFIKDPEGSRQKINKWVEKKTKEKIRDLIQRGMIDSLTRLVLCNAIYFKGQWAKQFKKGMTKREDFWVTSDKTAKVDMMEQTEDFRYREFGAFKAIELPYKGFDVSMVIFLPKEIDGLGKLEDMLNGQNIERWTSWLMASREMRVDVSLPKFEFEKGAELSKVLAKMGMPTAFSNAADFSGITGERDLFISKVVHKAFIEVDEEGSEAAAATAVVMKELVMELREISRPKVFRADHPFIFLIRDNRSGAILFIGRVTNPEG